MSLYLLVRFLHLASAIVLVGGVVARQLTRSVAKRAEDPRSLAAVLRATDPIERFMVIPGSVLAVLFGVVLALMTGAPIFGFLQGRSPSWLLAANLLILLTIPLVPLVFVPRGKAFGAHLQRAIDQGRMTPELRAGLRDPVVGLCHLFEMTALALVVVLMVFKPF
jgi:uncharacterized membrane protein